MGLRRKINYQWQLFIPLVATLWLIIGALAVWLLMSEREMRKNQIDEQLKLVCERIAKANEQDIDPGPFMDFAIQYFRDSPLYDRIRISVYKDGNLIKVAGDPISLSDSERALGAGITQHPNVEIETDEAPEDNFFCYNVSKSSDGRVVVYGALPFTTTTTDALKPSMKVVWGILLLAIAVTILSYFSTRYFGRNISILRSVAERAATDPNFIPPMDYPHDELGDISRQIVYMYNERSKAMQQQKREHSVALHAIEEKARLKRQLTNNINHELRTPIGVIKGYLDTILENPDMDDASRNHFLRKAQEHVNRLVNLITDVSAITRLEEGGDLIATEELDFHDVAYTISNDLAESGALGKMNFNFDVPYDCKVLGNYNLLSGMIINLAKNAGAYSKGSTCELVMTGEDAKFYRFEFRDDGVGVGEEHIPHLFERFYRIDSGRSRKSGGTGLGLPIVQNTVLAHGGTIEVKNRPEGGLVFAFTLPKYKQHRTGDADLRQTQRK